MPKWNDRKTSRYVGQSVPRVDGPAKVTGAAKYTADQVLPGMLYGVVLRSPYAAATITSVDTSAAEASPGVKAVHVVAGSGARIRFQGQEIAAVAAITEELARDAIKKIKVDYDVQPHSVRTAMAAKNPERCEPFGTTTSDEVTAALAGAKATVEGEYSVAVRLHTPLEPHGAVVRWDTGDALTVWCSTQGTHGVKQGIAANQGIPAGNARVLCDYIGGGFGSKLSPGTEGMMAASLAKKANAPVKLMADRVGEQLVNGNGPDGFARAKAGVSADGKIVALKADLFGTGGPGRRWGAPYPYVYDFGARDVNQHGVQTNCGPQAALRAPMHPQACALTEMLVDELAYSIGMDPMQFRLKNNGDALRRAQFELGAKLIGWDSRNKTPGAGTARFRRGMGCATGQWGGGGGGGSVVEVTINPDGSVESKVGSQDIGTGTRTYVASIVAEDLGIDLERVRAKIGDSNLGYSGSSGGSTTTPSLAPAVKSAAVSARSQLLEKAAEFLGAPVDQLDARDGKIFVMSEPSKSASFDQVCSRLSKAINAIGEFDPSLQQGGVAGVQFAEVQVDMWTGRVKPIKVIAVHDCGYAINRLTVESQIIGGVIQGIGMALLEDRKMDEVTGRCLNSNLETYKLPGTMEMPEIVPVIYDTHDKVAGIGEPPVIPTAGAIANAVYNASGLRIRHLPITPKRVLEAMP